MTPPSDASDGEAAPGGSGELGIPGQELTGPEDEPADADRDLDDPERPLQGDEARHRAQQRTLYLAASLIRRGFTPDLPRGKAGAAPQVRYLDRYVRLVRLLAHGERLFADILPRVRERLSFDPERYREERPFQARGPIDWPATLRGGWSRAETTPTVLVSRRPTRDYATPENQLAALTVVAVRRDASRLLVELDAQLDVAERAGLRRLVTHADRIRRVPQLAALMDGLAGDLLDAPEGTEALRLERATAERARYRPRTMTAYLDLVRWREDWRSWLTDATRALRRTPVWQVDDNKLYELLVLFELASAFAQRSRRAVQRSGTGERRPLFVFELEDGRELELWYQSSHGLKAYLLTGIPDVLVRVGGRTVLGDMKNYSPAGYTQAVYKMLGYLYNYGYPDRWGDIDAGVLFFPKSSDQHGGFTALKPRLPAPGSAQQLYSLVVPSAGVTGAAATWIADFADRLLRGEPGDA